MVQGYKEVKPNHFPDPFAEKTGDLPLQKEVCGLIGLERLNPDEVVITLSKIGYGHHSAGTRIL